MGLDRVEPRLFGVPPPLALLALALGAILGGLALALAASWLAAVILLLGAVVLLILFVEVVRRQTNGRLGRLTVRALDGVRDGAGFAVASVSTRMTARQEVLGLWRELEELTQERDRALRELGEAVYSGQEEAAEDARERIQGIDEQRRRFEEQLHQVLSSAREQLQREREAVGATVRLEEGEVTALTDESERVTGTP